MVGGFRSEDGHALSVAQWCDRRRWDQIKDQLSENELLHALAHSGPGHHWVTLPPLLHKNWNMPALEWLTATRRRLGVDVTPVERQCGFCSWNRCDTKGNHATMCIGGASCHLRHNEVRGVLAKALDSAGFQTAYEHSGGLNDERKPGDIIAYNWKGTKHLLVDVSVVNPLAPTYRKHLREGPGQTARYRETKKRDKYWDLDKDKYEFHPFILESTGAFGPSALNLCATIKNITSMKSCKARANHEANNASESASDNRTTVDPLPASISVIVQRHNAQMIIERQPPPAKLLAAGIEKSQQAAARVKEWAEKKLRSVPSGSGSGPVSRMEWECPTSMNPARSTAQNQPTHKTTQTNTPTTPNQPTTTQAQTRHCHLEHDLDHVQMDHDTTHPVGPRPRNQNKESNSVANITPVSEALITQKNKLRPTSKVSTQHTQRPHPNHPERDTHTNTCGLPQHGPRLHPNQATSTPTLTQQLDSTEHDPNYDEVGTHPQSTSGNNLTRHNPTLQTPQNPKPTDIPKQIPQNTKHHTHTRDAVRPRAGAEYTNGLGVRPPDLNGPSQHPMIEASLPKTQSDCHDPPWQAGRRVPNTLPISARHGPTTQVASDTEKITTPINEQSQHLTTTTHTLDTTGLQAGAESTT